MSQELKEISFVNEKDIGDINENNIIIYFCDTNIRNSQLFNRLEKINSKVIVIDKYKLFNNRYKKNIEKEFKRNDVDGIQIIIEVGNDFKYIKKMIKLISNLNYYKNLSINYLIVKDISKYEKDIINCIKAINIGDESKRYEFIYDTVCNDLTEEFTTGNYCDFKDDRCIANRENASKHDKMGCCYSFEYQYKLFWEIPKNVKVCQYLGEKGCTINCIGCKIFTCKYLRNKGININTHDILLLECFFNNKQHDTIRYDSYFKTKQEVLEKLKIKN